MPSIKNSLGNNEHISLDDVCFLLSSTSTQDELGQDVVTETERQIWCSNQSINRAEFAAAGQLNHRPELMLIVDSDEYDNERAVLFDGVRYTVYRSFMRPDGYTEIYCEVRSGG